MNADGTLTAKVSGDPGSTIITLTAETATYLDVHGDVNETDIIRKILEHLGLWEEKISLERAPPVSNPDRISEPFDEGWPQYQEPSVNNN